MEDIELCDVFWTLYYYNKFKKRLLQSPSEQKYGDDLHMEVLYELFGERLSQKMLKKAPNFRINYVKNRINCYESKIVNGRYYHYLEIHNCGFYVSFDAKELAEFLIESEYEIGGEVWMTKNFYSEFCYYLLECILSIKPNYFHRKHEWRIKSCKSKEEMEQKIINCISNYMIVISKERIKKLNKS